MNDLKIAEELLRLRLSQMIVNEKYKNNEFKVPIHMALGHEAIAISINRIMKDEDDLVLSHRNIHYNIARADSLKYEIDEYLLKKEGLNQGQLGSMNLANEEKNVKYTSSILGNNLPVAAGLALAKKIKKEAGVVIVVTGDGAIEEGSFYETLLFMKSNSLPALIIVENNQWSLATRIEERRCRINLSKFAETFEVGYIKLNSNDVYDYIEKLNQVRDYSISNKFPIIIEVDLTTLGSWIMTNEENPNGKFINYHAGTAPTVNIKDGPIIEKSEKDPVFVLNQYFDEKIINELSQRILLNLSEETR